MNAFLFIDFDEPITMEKMVIKNMQITEEYESLNSSPFAAKIMKSDLQISLLVFFITEWKNKEASERHQRGPFEFSASHLFYEPNSLSNLKNYIYWQHFGEDLQQPPWLLIVTVAVCPSPIYVKFKA